MAVLDERRSRGHKKQKAITGVAFTKQLAGTELLASRPGPVTERCWTGGLQRAVTIDASHKTEGHHEIATHGRTKVVPLSFFCFCQEKSEE